MIFSERPRIVAPDTDLSWAAGLFIGEGNVGQTKGHSRSGLSYTYLYIQLSMYDERAIERFSDIMRINYSTMWLPSQAHWIYKVSSSGRIAERILSVMWPWLKGTDKADQALKYAQMLKVE